MSLFKRHIGRRVVGVGVGVALLMLGLAGPAFAAGPTVASFTPTSGPIGCVLDVTGLGFQVSPEAQTHVFFAPSGTTTGGVEAVKTIISDTELWATVPTLTPAGADFTIRVDNLLGTGTPSTTTFLLTSGAGACAPTITSFTPPCGVAGDVFKITGTNLLAPDQGGGTVEFSPFLGTPPVGLTATPTNPDISDFTTLQVTVPTGVADGPIRVTTYGGTTGAVFSTTLFQTPPPDCPTAVGHTRSISLKLKDKLVAKGTVKSTETTPLTACAASVPVKIQRKVSGHWKTIAKTTTSDTGAYSRKIKNKKGKYRSIAVKTTLTSGEVCLKAKSPVRTH